MPGLSLRAHFVAKEATASNVGGVVTCQRALSNDAGHREHFAERAKGNSDMFRRFSENPGAACRPEREVEAFSQARGVGSAATEAVVRSSERKGLSRTSRGPGRGDRK